jgi:hypothetical protein
LPGQLFLEIAVFFFQRQSRFGAAVAAGESSFHKADDPSFQKESLLWLEGVPTDLYYDVSPKKVERSRVPGVSPKRSQAVPFVAGGHPENVT